MGRYRHKVAKMGGFLKNYWENNTSNSHVTVRRGEDIRFMLESVGKKERTPASVYKKSNCKVRSGLARISSMLEQYYEDLLDLGKYCAFDSDDTILHGVSLLRSCPSGRGGGL